MKGKFKLFATLLVAVLFITGCSSGKGGAGGAKTTLTVGTSAQPVTFDIQATNDSATTNVARQVYEPLLKQDEDLKLHPGLAVSWEAVDETTWEFKLRENVKWHNGDDFTADDVAWTLKRAIESPSIGHIVGSVDPAKIEVVDAYTIRIGTTQPFGPFLTHLAHPATGILNEKAVTAAGDNYATNPVGTGPYKFVEWNSGADLTLERFADYWGDAGKSEKIVFRFITDNTTRLSALKTGEIDIAYEMPPTAIKDIEADGELELVRDLNLSTAYVGFNVQKGPFQDKRVRQAVNYALDIDAILEHVYLGTGKPAKGPLNSLAFGAYDGLEPYGYDMDKAKALLAEAGVAGGFKFTIYVGDNNAQRIAVAEVVKEQLAQLGIEATIKQMEWAAYLEATANGEADMFILGWTTVTTDGDYGLYPLFHTDQMGAAGNRSFYSNKEVDKLLEDARTSTNQEERKELYKKAQVIINDEVPWIFVQDGETLTAIRKGVKGFRNHPQANHFLSGVTVE